MDYTPGTIVLSEIWKIFLWWIITIFRFFLSIKMIKVAKELIKTMVCRQVLIQVSKMILPKMPSSIAKRFQKFGDSWILCLNS